MARATETRGERTLHEPTTAAAREALQDEYYDESTWVPGGIVIVCIIVTIAIIVLLAFGYFN